MLIPYDKAAELAEVSESTVRTAVSQKRLPAFGDGTRKKVRIQDVRELWPKAADKAPQGDCRVFVFCNQKGGVGKTTIAVNVAAELAKDGSFVLLIDADPQGNTTKALGVDASKLKHTTYSVLMKPSVAADALVQPLEDQRPTLQLIGTNLRLSMADIELNSAVRRESRLEQALEPLKSLFDYIIIDLPPSLGLCTINALMAANEVIIPIVPGILALEGVADLFSSIEEVRNFNTSLGSPYALRNLWTRTDVAVTVAEAIQEFFGDRLMETTIPQSVTIQKAQLQREPLTIYLEGMTPSARGADKSGPAFIDLAAEVRAIAKGVKRV